MTNQFRNAIEEKKTETNEDKFSNHCNFKMLGECTDDIGRSLSNEDNPLLYAGKFALGTVAVTTVAVTETAINVVKAPVVIVRSVLNFIFK